LRCEVLAKAARVFLSQPAYASSRHWWKNDIGGNTIVPLLSSLNEPYLVLEILRFASRRKFKVAKTSGHRLFFASRRKSQTLYYVPSCQAWPTYKTALPFSLQPSTSVHLTTSGPFFPSSSLSFKSSVSFDIFISSISLIPSLASIPPVPDSLTARELEFSLRRCVIVATYVQRMSRKAAHYPLG
jgi:hypothetical protein